jgi:hypothetical protein
MNLFWKYKRLIGAHDLVQDAVTHNRTKRA